MRGTHWAEVTVGKHFMGRVDPWHRSLSCIRQPSEHKRKETSGSRELYSLNGRNKVMSQQNGVVNLFPDGVVAGVFEQGFFSVS